MEDDQLIHNIKEGKKRPGSNQELVDFIKRAIEQIEAIKQYYKKLHEGTGEEESIISQIEAILDQVKRAHKDLFEADEKGAIKVQLLNQKIDEIKEYHKQLLEGDSSIKKDIDKSQLHITDFYKFLFEAKEGQETNETKIRTAIEKITDFHDKIATKIEEDVGRIYKKLTEKYSELFDAKEGEKSKMALLDENISKINKFDAELEEKVKPNLEKKQKYLNELQIDIDKKSKDVNSLLESATGGAIAEGYRQSMATYSKPEARQFKEAFEVNNRGLIFMRVISIFLHNYFIRHIGQILNYLMFILPLISIILIFLEIHIGEFEIKLNIPNGKNGMELILFKTVVSLPLLWIAWFGQSNISKRKRLYEEYNHKLRAVQMYLNFNAREKEYPLSKKSRENLEETVLGAIDKNPAEHLGKGETMIDKLLEKFHLAGLYKQLINEVKGELNPLKTDKND